MNLYLLRHAPAADRAESGRDADRPLTPEGRHKLRGVVAAIQALEIDFNLILTSPCVRARQTAEAVADGFGARKRIELCSALAPGGSARELIAELNQRQPMPEEVLLVGHEPDLSGLISLLVAGDRGLAVVMKKASLCRLSAGALRPGRCAALEWLLTSKQMGLMCEPG